MKARLTFIIGIAMAAVSGQIMAHHSFQAAFDADKPVKVTGTVTSIEWMNPHTWFFVDVEDPDGTVTNWGSSSPVRINSCGAVGCATR